MTYTTKEFCHVTGASQRQAQWWDETGLISPNQTHKREYSAFDCVLAILVLELRRKHMSIPRIRPVIETLQGRLRGELQAAIAMLVHEQASYLVVKRSGGADIADDARKAATMADYADCPVLVVDLKRALSTSDAQVRLVGRAA